MQAKLIQGDSLNFTTAPRGYPASEGWALRYTLVPVAGGERIGIDATVDGDEFRVTVAASATEGWAPGEYGWSVAVSKAGDRHTLDSGTLTILADPRTSNTRLDVRSQAEIALATAKAAFATWDGTRKMVTLNGRSVTFNTPAEIAQVVSYWEQEVQREQEARGLSLGLRSRRSVYVRFGNA
jgi:hypothetical protein